MRLEENRMTSAKRQNNLLGIVWSKVRIGFYYTTMTNLNASEMPRYKQLHPWLAYQTRVPMTEVKPAVVDSVRASNSHSSNDIHRTKTWSSLAEVEEHRVWNLRIFAGGVAGWCKDCSSVPILASSGG